MGSIGHALVIGQQRAKFKLQSSVKRRRECAPPEKLLNRHLPFFVRADADDFLHIGNKYLAIPDFARPRGSDNGVNGVLDPVIRQNDFNPDLGQKIDRVFAAPVNLSVPFLAAEALDFGDGHAFDSDLGQGVFDFLQFKRLDNRVDFFHSNLSKQH